MTVVCVIKDAGGWMAKGLGDQVELRFCGLKFF